MPDTIGRPGGLMLSRLASVMKLSGLELGQVDTTRLGNIRIFGLNFKKTFCLSMHANLLLIADILTISLSSGLSV